MTTFSKEKFLSDIVSNFYSRIKENSQVYMAKRKWLSQFEATT